jgi:hypothetical protein
MDDIELPPLPPMTRYELATGWHSAGYGEQQTLDYARAAILADRERRRGAPSAEPVAWVSHQQNRISYAPSRPVGGEWEPLYTTPPDYTAAMLAHILRCRYPVDQSIRGDGFDWDVSRLNEVVADLDSPAPSAEPVAIDYFVLHDFATRNHVRYNDMCAAVRSAVSVKIVPPAPSAEPVAWRWSERGCWFDWTTDWSHHARAKKLGYPVEYASPTQQPAPTLPPDAVAAMRLALDALKVGQRFVYADNKPHIEFAIESLRAALGEPKR